MLAALAVAALAVPAPYDLREAAQNVTPKAREPTFAPLAPCDAGFVPTCEQAKGFGLCDSANAACDEACVEEVKMACPVTCSLPAEATSAHLVPDAAPSDYGDHLPPAATKAICSTCAAQPDLPCCHDHPHEGNGRRRLMDLEGQTGSGLSCRCGAGDADHPDCQHIQDDVQDVQDDGTGCAGSSTTLAKAQEEGCQIVTGDLTDGGAGGDVNLPILRVVAGGITVKYNPNLVSLTMNNLNHVGGDIYVQRNDKLASLAMNSLQDVDGGIGVMNNPNLVSLTMLDLERVGSDIAVMNNPNLVSLTMPSLEEVVIGPIRVDPTPPASCDLGDFTNTQQYTC